MGNVIPMSRKTQSSKTAKKNQHIGSDFDDFLREERILTITNAVARKRIAWYQAGKKRIITNMKGDYSMDKWNYRVVRRKLIWKDWKTKKNRNGFMYDIHEAYYGNKGKITAITLNPVGITGETMEEMRHTWVRMAEAFGQPILDYSKFGNPEMRKTGKEKKKGDKRESKPPNKSGAAIKENLGDAETITEILRKDSEINHRKRFGGVTGLKKLIKLLAEDYLGENQARSRATKI
jgi:hypothetical protein